MKKSLFYPLFSAFVLLISELSGGEVLISLSKPKEFYAAKYIKAQPDGSLLVKRGGISSRKKVPVSTGKRYRVSCSIRTLSSAGGKARIGVNPWSNGVPANISGVLPVKGTETEVVRAISASDKVIYLKDCSKWQKVPTRIVFDIDPDGQMRDIPNFDILNGQAVKWQRKGDCWEVTMNHPVRTDLDAGVAVRQHIATRSAIFSPERKISSAWQNIEFIIGPGTAAAANEVNKLFKGVTHVTFMMQFPPDVLLKNIKIEEIK